MSDSIAAPGTPPSGPAGASSASTGHVERLEIANRALKTASIEAIERAEQAEAERDRYARRADDRADHITRLIADRSWLLHYQRVEQAEAAIARVVALADRWKRNGTRDLARYADIMLAELEDVIRQTFPKGDSKDAAPTTPDLLAETAAMLQEVAPAAPDAEPNSPFPVEAATCGDCNHPADWHDRYEGCVGPNGIGGLGSGDCTCTRGNPFDFSDTGPVPEEPPQPAVAELAQAIRLTREYVGSDLLPAVEGWAWYDALRKWAPHELPEPESGSSTSPELGDPGFKETAETLNTGPAVPDAEPDTVTDPAWLHQQYAKAIAADDGHPWDTLPADRQESYLDNADAVMRVRDRHVEQLRQRLTLAEHFHQDIATVRERADRYAATLREVLDALDRNGGVPPTETDVDRWRAVLTPKET